MLVFLEHICKLSVSQHLVTSGNCFKRFTEVFGYFPGLYWSFYFSPCSISEWILGFLAPGTYLCLNYHPGPLLSVAHSLVDVTLVVVVVAVAVSGVKRWLSVLLVVKTATVTLHPSAAGGSA